MPRKKTHEEFVAELAEINSAIAVTGFYVNANTRISVKCKDCGHEWDPIPASLINLKSGCPKCAKARNSKRRMKTHEQFMDELEQRGIDNVDVLGRYSGVDTKILVRCKTCGYEWMITPGHLKGGRGCPKCSGHHKRSQQEFVADVAKINSDVEVLGQFSTRKEQVETRCLKCGNIWFPTAGSLLAGHGCRKCAGNLPLTHDQFVARLKDISPDIEILGRYEGMTKEIEAKCLTCGSIWYPLPHNLLRGSTCLKCSYKKRGEARSYDTETFKRKLTKVNPRIEVIGKYRRSHEKIKVKCLECGESWEAAASSLLAGHGCPSCIARNTSFMEQYLLHSFRAALGEHAVLARDRTMIGKELDIVFPEYQMALEPGSWFWHKTKQDSDAEKRDLCKAKGICLLTIFDCYDGEAPLFEENCWVYRYDLRSEVNHETLKRIVSDVLVLLGKEDGLASINWEAIEKSADLSSRMMTNDEFIAAVKSIRPDVEVLTEFRNTKSYVRARCRECGHEWKVKAGSLLRGSGCRKCGRKVCADKLRMTHEEYVAKLAEINGDIEVLGEYRSSNEPIRVKCSKCGHEWEPVAVSLTSGGRGCPQCWESKRGEALIKPENEFYDEFRIKGNPQVQILGDYKKLSERIDVKCKECGYGWKPRAKELLKGHGCPRCAGHLKKTHEQFVREVNEKNPDVQVVGRYKNANTEIEVCCKKCGYSWMPRAISLTKTNAHGCPMCARRTTANKQRRTQEQFELEVATIQPNLEVLGKYINANTKVDVRCRVCGYEWDPKPSYILNMGRGCPKCSGSR